LNVHNYEDREGHQTVPVLFTEEKNQLGQTPCVLPMYPPQPDIDPTKFEFGVPLTREQVIAVLGDLIVRQAEAANCEYSHTLEDGWEAWTAYIIIPGTSSNLSVVYHQSPDSFIDPDTGEDYEDLDRVDWKIDHYTIDIN